LVAVEVGACLEKVFEKPETQANIEAMEDDIDRAKSCAAVATCAAS